MGTNYYLRHGICDKCERYDERHIGKASAGWKFLFRSYESDAGSPSIKTFIDWRGRTQKYMGLIYNQYGDLIEYDDFWKMVAEKQNGKEQHLITEYNRIYIDKDGYNFANYEFS